MNVLKGRALAPPCTVFRIGVSTSVKPSVSRVRRMDVIIAERIRRFCTCSGLTSRSVERRRRRASGSVNESNGMGCRHLEAIRQSVASTETVPLREVPMLPVMSRISPVSTVWPRSRSACAPTAARSITTWRVRPFSMRVRKTTPP